MAQKTFVLFVQILDCCTTSVRRHFVLPDKTKPPSVQGWLWACTASQIHHMYNSLQPQPFMGLGGDPGQKYCKSDCSQTDSGTTTPHIKYDITILKSQSLPPFSMKHRTRCNLVRLSVKNIQIGGFKYR